MKNCKNTLIEKGDSLYHKLRWMKLYVVLLSVLLIIPVQVFSQQERVSLKMENAELEEILKEIQKQTGLNYIFNNEEVEGGAPITISAENETVTSVLEKCLKERNLTFKIIDKVIVITPKPVAKPKPLGQVVRGKVVDVETQLPLPFASVAISTTEPVIGAITDDNGEFRIENVPVGRHILKVSFVGYETLVMPEILVTTGKEIVLGIKMKEQFSELEEVQVKSYSDKGKPLNTMASVSARSFSVEEARRYAGGFDDPSRLAASFAGITTENTRDNTIIIRGNSPKGVLWRLEGVEISNPNHFANQATFGGGGISAISALVMGNSDFFTGAFPAEYGNATSGVFDIKLRQGNNEKREHAIQVGTMGIDLSSEGYIKKNSKASYIFNYRYSTMGLLKELFPEDIKNFIPVYQDLSFKVNMPTQKSGLFSVWGLASGDKSNFPAIEDTSKWENTMNRLDNNIQMGMGALGLNHRYVLGNRSWINTSLAVSGDYMNYTDDILDYDLSYHKYNSSNIRNYKYTFTSVLNRKFSIKHSNRSGIVLNKMNYDIDMQHSPEIGQELMSIAKEKGSSYKMQAFTQSKFNLTNRFTANAGLHGLYFHLNKEFVVEPRLSLTYKLNSSQSVGLAYGKHSRIEPLSLYFAEVNNGNGETYQPNKDLKLSKAHHIVFAYDLKINSDLRLKIEPYVQFLYDVPVIPDSNYSVLNLETEWFYFDQELINTGTGRNVGIDFTLERFLNRGFYYLITASFFDSKYTGDNGIGYNTRFNSNYVFNVLYGKEWIVGKENNKIFGVNGKVSYYGGRRTTPINQEQSAVEEDVVYHYSQLYTEKEEPKFYLNITINYRVNKKKYSGIWSFKMMNVLLTTENYGYFYNYDTRTVEPWELAVPTPSLSYKIEF